MSMKSLISSLVLVLLILTCAAAQSPSASPTESKEEQEKARKELERKALALLDETVESAQMLKLAENRTLVQATAADLVWTHDEKRARNLFRDAMTALGEEMSGAGEKLSSYDPAYWALMQLRRQTLQMIARRDPQLALDLLRSTRPQTSENPANGRRGMDPELLLEQSIATQVAANDPKKALQLAQESLAKGISFGLLPILRQLQQKDSEAASKFALDIIKKLQTESSGRNREAGYIAGEMLQWIVQPDAQGQGMILSAIGPQQQSKQKPQPLKLEESAVRDLADTIVSMALGASTIDPGFMMSLQPLLPELEKRVPERAAQLRKKLSDANKALDPEAREWMRTESMMRSADTEDLLQQAAKASPEMRSALYTTAAMKLLQSGEAERARQVVNDNLSGQQRDQLLALIDQQLIAQAVEQGKPEDAKQLALRLRTKEARASALSQLALKLAEKGDRKTALQLLGEAQGMINRQPENQEQLNALIQLARAFTLIEPSRAFELIEPMVDQANEMLAAAALLEKFGGGRGAAGYGQGLFKKGEMLMQPGFIMTADQVMAQYGKALAALARADFDHTKGLADRLQRQEARIMARMLIAQSILSDHPVADQPGASLGVTMGTGILIAR